MTVKILSITEAMITKETVFIKYVKSPIKFCKKWKHLLKTEYQNLSIKNN